jgi:hypothetical protein
MPSKNFPSKEDKQNAINTVSYATIFIVLVAFKVAFDYDYTTTFLTALALGLGYLGFIGGHVGKQIGDKLKTVPLLDRKIVGVELSLVLMPAIVFLGLWLFQEEVDFLEFSLAYMLGTAALITPTRIYDSRDYKLIAYLINLTFLAGIFYSTIQFGWPGLIIWTAIILIAIKVIDVFQGKYGD